MTHQDRIVVVRTVVVAAAIGAVLLVVALTYGASARRAAIATARVEAARRAALEAGAMLADVEKFRTLPYVLTELPDVAETLGDRVPAAVARLDHTLAALVAQTGATVFYAVDRAGVARAASNAGRPSSFVGHDFRFRPYFVDALRHGSSEYFARGIVTGRPGLFLARRVGPAARPVGVVVIKIEFERIERLWRSAGRPVLVVDRDSVVVMSTDPRRRFRTIEAVMPSRRAAIARSRQFGDAPLAQTGLSLRNGFARDETGTRYLMTVRHLPLLGWRLVHLEPLQPILAAADARTRLVILTLGIVLAGAALLAAWGRSRRRRARAAQETLEAEVARRTIELTDAYQRLHRESEERAEADSRYRAAREQLAQANRLGSIGTITTSVAHELNQPLAAIRTSAENAIKLMARARPDNVAENLRLIVSLTDRIGSITRQLLSYARRGQGGRSLVALDAIVDGALLLIGDSFRRAGIRLSIDRQGDLPRVYAEPIRLEQVLVNLLQNALDALADGRGRHVRLAISADDTHVRLAVEDDGAGVPPELRETIFQPFYTGRPQGTGLGLGISREIVHDHGGTLVLADSAAGGAAFVVTLPIDERVTA